MRRETSIDSRRDVYASRVYILKARQTEVFDEFHESALHDSRSRVSRVYLILRNDFRI